MVSFGAVPKPIAGRLNLYIFGPGFGESQIIVLPDRKCVVIDACTEQGKNVVREALLHFGLKQVDLLVVTHADLDHVNGLADLIANVTIRRVWRYPGAGTLVDILPRLLRLFPTDQRLREVSAALDALDQLQERNIVHDVGTETRVWKESAGCEVAAVAPTPKDVGRYRRDFERALVELGAGNKPQITQRLRQFLVNASDTRLSPGANPLSIALAIKWKQCGIVLGGDVEHSKDPESGWNGIVAILKEDGREALIQNSTVVKGAHHGSKHSFCEAAWKQHSLNKKVAHVVITPFNRGKKSPPHTEALKKIRPFAVRLGVTAKPRATLPGSGWQKKVG